MPTLRCSETTVKNMNRFDQFGNLQDVLERQAQLKQNERRIGKTGIWTFVLETGDGRILARSEWGHNYEFNKQQWLELLIAP